MDHNSLVNKWIKLENKLFANYFILEFTPINYISSLIITFSRGFGVLGFAPPGADPAEKNDT